MNFKFRRSASYMACLMIGTSILVSCNDEMANVISPEEEIQNQIKAEYVTLSFNVSADEAASRTSYEESGNKIIAKWTSDDCIYVGTPAARLTEAVSINSDNSGFTILENPTISDDGKTATFSGTVAVTPGSKIMAFYCKEPKMLEVTSTGVRMNLELGQYVSGINDLSQYDLMSATADYTEGTESIDLNFVHDCAVLKVNATGLGADAPVRELEFTLPDGAGFYSAVTIGTDGTKTYSDAKNTFNVQLNGAVATEGELGAYCMVVTDGISAATNLGIKAIVDKPSGDYTYTSGLNVSSNIENGKFYYTPEIAMTLDNEIKTLEGFKVIDNVDKFKTIASDASSNYILIRDLDFTGIDFTPIPTFSGTFEGIENTLSNITLNITDGNGGIFAVNEGTIQNLIVEGATVTQAGTIAADNGVGILVGTNSKTISNCSVLGNSSITATVSGSTQGNLGLLAGFNKGVGSIKECNVINSSIEITNSSSVKSNVGGFAGKSIGSVKFSYADNVTVSHLCDLTGGGSNIGGFLGYGNGTIEGCSSNAQISDAQTSGNGKAITIAGFIGTAWIGNGTVTIKGCYASGTVTSQLQASTNGGFIGNCTGNGYQEITNCYTNVNLTDANSKFNGSAFIKNINNTKATECYYVNGTQNIPTGKEQDLNIESATAANLKGMASSFNTALNWSDYEFVVGTDDEPLIIQKKQQ